MDRLIMAREEGWPNVRDAAIALLKERIDRVNQTPFLIRPWLLNEVVQLDELESYKDILWIIKSSDTLDEAKALLREKRVYGHHDGDLYNNILIYLKRLKRSEDGFAKPTRDPGINSTIKVYFWIQEGIQRVRERLRGSVK